MAGKSSKTRSVNPSGKKQDILDQIIRDKVEEGNPDENVRYQGIILYSAYLKESIFRSKYDETFVEYVLNIPSNRTDKKRIIIESIVYIDKISGCLPRPNQQEEVGFYNYIRDLSKTDKQEGFDAIAKNSKGLSGKHQLHLEKIKRYPKAYAVLMGGASNLSDYGIGQKVIVQFPYDYDIYAGAIIGQLS